MRLVEELPWRDVQPTAAYGDYHSWLMDALPFISKVTGRNMRLLWSKHPNPMKPSHAVVDAAVSFLNKHNSVTLSTPSSHIQVD
jgi:hypothetical protein